MGGVISFSKNDEESWLVAGWAFRQVLDDVTSQHPEDLEMANEFEEAKALSGLILYRVPPELAARITRAISEAATGILAGTIRSGILDKPYGDALTVEQYHGGLRQLLDAIPKPR